MQKKLVKATLTMNKMVSSTAKQIKEYQLEMLNKYIGKLNEKEKNDPNTFSSYSKVKRSMSKMVVEQLNDENYAKMKNVTLAIYEEELR